MLMLVSPLKILSINLFVALDAMYQSMGRAKLWMAFAAHAAAEKKAVSSDSACDWNIFRGEISRPVKN